MSRILKSRLEATHLLSSKLFIISLLLTSFPQFCFEWLILSKMYPYEMIGKLLIFGCEKRTEMISQQLKCFFIQKWSEIYFHG